MELVEKVDCGLMTVTEFAAVIHARLRGRGRTRARSVGVARELSGCLWSVLLASAHK